jgi:hypothetical protein
MRIAFNCLRATDDVQETALYAGGVIQAFKFLHPVEVISEEPATWSDKVDYAGQNRKCIWEL